MDQWTVYVGILPIHISILYSFEFSETIGLPINLHFAWIGMFFWSECPLISSCGKLILFDSCLTRVCLTIGKPALQSKPKKKLTRKKENIYSPPITTQRIFILFVSWGACSQSALPLKSYRGAENNPMWDSRCIDSILSSCSPLTPPRKFISHDLAAYSLSSSFHFHVNGTQNVLFT